MKTSSTAASAVEPTSDWRRSWGVLLAVVAPAPWLALAISNAVTPENLGGSAGDQFTSFAAHHTAATIAAWAGVPFLLLLVPSALAMLVAARRVAPTWGIVVCGYFVFACGAGAAVPNTSLIALITAEHRLDQATGIAIADKIASSPLYVALVLPFFLLITIGRIALGLLLWRIRIAPRWMAVALALSVPVEFLIPGNAGPALCYVLTAIGFASATVALLRSNDADIDPPLTPIARQQTSHEPILTA